MNWPHLFTSDDAVTFVPERSDARYCVVRREDCWFIVFEGKDYGPYKTEREAMLFAVDAAQTLGENGRDTRVCFCDEGGAERLLWTYGQDSYPPRFR